MSDLFFDVNLRGDLRRLQRRMACLFGGFAARLRATSIGRFFARHPAVAADDPRAEEREGPASGR